MRILAALVLVPALFSQQLKEDIILKAMKDELARCRALRVVGDPPYFIEYTLDDADIFVVTASYGALVGERMSRVRQPRVRIRVGDPKLDNSNHIFSDSYRGSRYDPSQFSLDDNYDTLRLGFWLATDRAYKQSLEALARKKASLKNMVAAADQLPDFSTAPAVSMILPPGKKAIDAAHWRTAVKEISALFSSTPEVLLADANVSISQTTSYMMNNEGGEYRIPDNLASVRVRASGLAPDGMAVRDYAEFHASDYAKLPSAAELKQAAAQVAANVQAMSKAGIIENYSGPVLFEGKAGAQLMAELIGRGFTITRRPVTDPERPLNLPTGDLEGRVGSRILPEWMDVVDDATQKEFQGVSLLGHYPIDVEGVVPKAIPLVEKGVLKTYYSTRQPIQGVESSNGHARLPGSLGNNTALLANLFIKANQAQPVAELKKRLLDMAKQRNKPFVIIVRKMDFPSTSSLDELRRIGGGQQGKAVSRPLQIFKVTLDGKEESLRGVRFRGLSARTMKEILAASEEQYMFHYLENGAPFAHMDAGGYVSPTTVVSPALLFEDLELEKIPGELPRPPIVPPPPLTN